MFFRPSFSRPSFSRGLSRLGAILLPLFLHQDQHRVVLRDHLAIQARARSAPSHPKPGTRPQKHKAHAKRRQARNRRRVNRLLRRS